MTSMLKRSELHVDSDGIVVDLAALRHLVAFVLRQKGPLVAVDILVSLTCRMLQRLSVRWMRLHRQRALQDGWVLAGEGVLVAARSEHLLAVDDVVRVRGGEVVVELVARGGLRLSGAGSVEGGLAAHHASTGPMQE